MAWNIRTSKQVTPDLEILVHQVNVDVAASIVLDATAVAPDGVTGERVLKAGTILSKNATSGQYERFTAGAGQSVRGILAHTVRFADGTSKSDAPAALWHHGQWFRSDRIVDWATHQAAVKTALPTCKFT